MRRVLGFILVAAALTAACGGKGGSSPTAPSGNGSSSARAVITGSVQGAAGAFTAASVGAAITGLTVTVVGTNISATVDAGGRFALTNVPTGTVQLQLTGGGANATVTINTVEASQTIDVVLSVAGTSASLESEVRSGAGEAQLEGRVESLPPTMAALSFKAAGRTVKTDSTTRFLDGSQTRSFADLQIGMRIHAKGTLSGDTFTATVVEMQNSNVNISVEVNGVIDSVTGTASAFQFKIGSRVIKGDGQTSFDGGKSPSFAALKDGVRVEVKGQQRDGFIYATRVHVEDHDSDDDGDDTGDDDDHGHNEIELKGAMSALQGACPALRFVVNGTSISTGTTTRFDDGCGSLKNGTRVEVKGTKQTDGSVAATRVKKD